MKAMSGRRLLRYAVLSALFATGAALTVVAPLGARRAAGGITVFVSCAMKQQNHTYDATFGFTNSTGAVQTIALGSANHLTAAAPSGRKPPTTFQPGTDSSALFVSNQAVGSTFTWVVTFGGVTSTATASAQSAKCNKTSSGPPPTTTGTTPSTPPSAPPGPVDVGLVKTVAPLSVVSGQRAVYTLRIVNHGPRTAVGVKAIDRLPSGLVLVHASIPHGTCTQARLVVCRVASLGVGRSVSARIVTRVDAREAVLNSAIVTAIQPETSLANNKSRVLLHVAKPKGRVSPGSTSVHATPHFTG
jgi:uncharacterized repeat protein (TIGR01451 family)